MSTCNFVMGLSHACKGVVDLCGRVSAKPGLWTVDWTVDWNVDWTVDYVLDERCASQNWSDDTMASIDGEVYVSANPDPETQESVALKVLGMQMENASEGTGCSLPPKPIMHLSCSSGLCSIESPCSI